MGFGGEESGLCLTSKTLTEMLRWVAQTTHQAYHQECAHEWTRCSKDICLSVSLFLRIRGL
jgi:hypothetical protein